MHNSVLAESRCTKEMVNRFSNEQSVMDLRENTKELPILSNFSEQHGSLFAVNSSSVVDCRPAENKYVEYVPMIGACSYPYNLAPNKDSIPEVVLKSISVYLFVVPEGIYKGHRKRNWKDKLCGDAYILAHLSKFWSNVDILHSRITGMVSGNLVYISYYCNQVSSLYHSCKKNSFVLLCRQWLLLLGMDWVLQWIFFKRTFLSRPWVYLLQQQYFVLFRVNMSNWAQEFAPEFPISKTVYQSQAIVEFQNTTSICNKLSCLIISSLHVWFLHISVLKHFHDFSLSDECIMFACIFHHHNFLYF